MSATPANTNSKKSLPVVTNSEMTVFRRCQREHHYLYRLGYRAVEEAEALRFGTMIHLGLECWWRGDGLDAAIAAAVDGASDEFEAARARVLLIGYDARWADEQPSERVLGVEVEFRAPLLNPETGAASRTYQLGGKMDVLLDGAYVEHKTSSQEIGLGSVYWQRLRINSQVSTYYAGAKQMGHDIRKCIYDVIRKPTLRPSQVALTDENGVKIVLDGLGQRVRTKDGKKWRQTADTEQGYVLQTRPETPAEYADRLAEDVGANPDKYYQRGEVVRLEEDEREAALDAWQLTRSMREVELLGRTVRNPDACERYGKLCSFFSVCTGMASLDDQTRFERVENVHQELTAA